MKYFKLKVNKLVKSICLLSISNNMNEKLKILLTIRHDITFLFVKYLQVLNKKRKIINTFI
jgi:hypothetical protein